MVVICTQSISSCTGPPPPPSPNHTKPRPGCFGFNGPLKQYFSLYRAVSQIERKKKDRGEKKCPFNLHGFTCTQCPFIVGTEVHRCLKTLSVRRSNCTEKQGRNLCACSRHGTYVCVPGVCVCVSGVCVCMCVKRKGIQITL